MFDFNKYDFVFEKEKRSIAHQFVYFVNKEYIGYPSLNLAISDKFHLGTEPSCF